MRIWVFKGPLGGRINETKETVSPEVVIRLYPYYDETYPQFTHIAIHAQSPWGLCLSVA